MGTFLGVPIIRTIVYWGLYLGTLIVGNYQMSAGMALVMVAVVMVVAAEGWRY